MSQVIYVDAGHGGPDAGAVSGGVKESDINIKIAHRAGELIGFHMPMVYTRDYRNQEETSLPVRAAMPQSDKDLFVSIHCNGHHNELVKGLEVIHFPGSADGFKLAVMCLESIMKVSHAAGYQYVDRGVIARPDLYVLKHTVCPAVLIECGFLSNQSDREWITSSIGQVAVGGAVALAVLQYAGVK